MILGSAGLLFADGGGLREPLASSSPPRWGGGELRGSKNRKIHMRQPNARRERFRIKGGRSDGALKIGDLLIASKVPKASDLAKSRERPRNSFTAAAFGATF